MPDIVVGTSFIFSHFIFIIMLTIGDPSVLLHLVESITIDILIEISKRGGGFWSLGERKVEANWMAEWKRSRGFL